MAGFITVRDIQPADRPVLEQLIPELWGSPLVVSRGRLINPALLPGFIAEKDAQLAGVATYQVENGNCELVTINSIFPGEGIGSALIEHVRRKALDSGCQWLWLITTNDNLNALGFYQKRGFVLAALYPGAVTTARFLKREIPLVADNGIPIRDEIQLQMPLNQEGS
jgi:N-acetylglutamate synthase-like GNAT family acetyltransferase